MLIVIERPPAPRLEQLIPRESKLNQILVQLFGRAEYILIEMSPELMNLAEFCRDVQRPAEFLIRIDL